MTYVIGLRSNHPIEPAITVTGSLDDANAAGLDAFGDGFRGDEITIDEVDAAGNYRPVAECAVGSSRWQSVTY